MKNVFSRTRCKGIHNCVRTQYFKKNNATAPFFIDINQEGNKERGEKEVSRNDSFIFPRRKVHIKSV